MYLGGDALMATRWFNSPPTEHEMFGDGAPMTLLADFRVSGPGRFGDLNGWEDHSQGPNKRGRRGREQTRTDTVPSRSPLSGTQGHPVDPVRYSEAFSSKDPSWARRSEARAFWIRVIFRGLLGMEPGKLPLRRGRRMSWFRALPRHAPMGMPESTPRARGSKQRA